MPKARSWSKGPRAVDRGVRSRRADRGRVLRAGRRRRVRGVARRGSRLRASSGRRSRRVCSSGSGSTVTPQPVLAVAREAASRAPTGSRATGLVVVGVELGDPGNVGTLLRSAEASAAAGIVLSRGSVDAYNPKVVRASAGAIFGVPVMEEWSAVEALDALGELGRQRLGAVAGTGTPYADVDFRRPDRGGARATRPTASATTSPLASTATSPSRWPRRRSRSTSRWRARCCASSPPASSRQAES